MSSNGPNTMKGITVVTGNVFANDLAINAFPEAQIDRNMDAKNMKNIPSEAEPKKGNDPF